MTETSARLGRGDVVAWAGVASALALSLGRFFAWGAEPTEDAAILMRYAAHLASGHGIVWNVGEAPVDGATDFLFMAAIAALVKLGLSLPVATRALALGAHALTVGAVYGAARRRSGATMAGLAAGFVAVGPGLAYAEAYFGTTFFAMWAALTWAGAMRLRDGVTTLRAGVCALCALGLGLTRPDGVLLAGLIFAGLATQLDRRDVARVFVAFAAVFGTLGVAYFAWRWWYFGFPLPNPYYKKGGFHLWVGSFATAVTSVARSLAPLIPIYVAALGRRHSAREALFSAVPICGFTALWILVSDEMNYLGRFQYAIVPIAAMSAPSLVRAMWAQAAGAIAPATAAGAARLASAALVFVAWPLVEFRPALPDGQDGRAVVGEALAPYADRGYTLATTEAGLLPLHSGWRAIDTWGLNDATIAHAGALSPEYLAAQSPEVVLVHRAGSVVFQDPSVGAELGPAWDAMTTVLRDYCAARGFTLAAAWGASHTDSFEFWVAGDIPEHDEFVRAVREARFDFLGGRGVFVDWARLQGTLAPARAAAR